MKFTEELRAEVVSIWNASFEHPFILELANGTLAIEKFRYYLLQDSYYLFHFAELQEICASKAKDVETKLRFLDHAESTRKAELGLHQTFFEMLEIRAADKVSFQPAPTAYNYTSHMYRVAQDGDLAEVLSVILPCYWLYLEIGERLKDANPNHPIYDKWISTYGSEWFKASVIEQINRLDQLAEQASHESKSRMKDHFIISSQFEYQFWEMAYTMENWPIKV